MSLTYVVTFHTVGRRAWSTRAMVAPVVKPGRRTIVAARIAAHTVWPNTAITSNDDGTFRVNETTYAEVAPAC